MIYVFYDLNVYINMESYLLNIIEIQNSNIATFYGTYFLTAVKVIKIEKLLKETAALLSNPNQYRDS